MGPFRCQIRHSLTLLSPISYGGLLAKRAQGVSLTTLLNHNETLRHAGMDTASWSLAVLLFVLHGGLHISIRITNHQSLKSRIAKPSPMKCQLRLLAETIAAL